MSRQGMKMEYQKLTYLYSASIFMQDMFTTVLFKII